MSLVIPVSSLLKLNKYLSYESEKQAEVEYLIELINER